MFSVLIPSWNNLEYLKLCVDSIRKHSQYEHEIIVHVNEGSDGTLDWLKAQGIKYSHSHKNVGVCLSVNHLVSLASHDWVVYMNDDMVACPGWDTAFAKAIASSGTDLALYFATLIEPNTTNPGMIAQDFGRTPQDFSPERLLREYMLTQREDIEGRGSQPTLVSRKWWQMVGGYSLEFSPGMSSDDDLLMKFWVAGCRNFRIVGASRFYHFGCKSTGRIRHNLGGRVFVMKWGITQKEFYSQYLAKVGQKDAPGFPRATLIGKLRRAGYGLFGDYPLEGIGYWDPAPGQTTWREEG